MSLANIKKVDKMDNPTPTPQPHKIIWHHLQQKITEIVKNPISPIYKITTQQIDIHAHTLSTVYAGTTLCCYTPAHTSGKLSTLTQVPLTLSNSTVIQYIHYLTCHNSRSYFRT